ncbi:MAG TPA: ROK family protein [Jatrophihabitans sp.]
MTLIGTLDVGGTHVTAALVDASAQLVGERSRVPVESLGDADSILDSYAAAARPLLRDEVTAWGIAMPGPFDYKKGIGLFHGVGKYEALYNFDVRTALAQRLGAGAAVLHFVNDADAFTLGEALQRGVDRLVGITLGTGIGSGWVAGGTACIDGAGVPPGGRINDPTVPGSDIEKRISRRVIRGAYAEATGMDLDVRAIAERARGGEDAAISVLSTAFRALGAELGPRLRDFQAELLVLGGSMAASWDVFEGWFRDGASGTSSTIACQIAVSDDPERSALLGAALSARP